MRWLSKKRAANVPDSNSHATVIELSEDPLATLAGVYNKNYEKSFSVSR